MQMKALSIPASRLSMRELTSAISATVSNLRAAIPASVFLTVAIIAISVFFFALGAMHVPSIIVSGLTALITAAIAPLSKEWCEL